MGIPEVTEQTNPSLAEESTPNGTGAEATIPAFLCLINSVLMQFFLVYQLDTQQRDRAVAGITRALEQGRLVGRIGPTFPLSETAAAHEAVEHGTVGNVIVKVT